MQEQRQAITLEQLEQIKAECLPNVQTSTRQVVGGFILTGRIDWIKGSQVQAVQTDECVVTSTDEIAARIGQYHDFNTFEYEKIDAGSLRKDLYSRMQAAQEDRP